MNTHESTRASTANCNQERRTLMTINAGVWIDHHKAVILLITEQGEDLRQIISDDTKTAHPRWCSERTILHAQ